MDINFRIIWFEDVDEWFNSLSRRLSRYIIGKNLKVEIERVKGVKEFDINKYQIRDYDLLVVDYELEKEIENGVEKKTYGYQIINIVRSGKFVNDVLFYSSHGFTVVNDVMKNNGLQGVFVADRDNGEFMTIAQALVDKAIRRSENIVNIRGVVMDNTSEFDNKIRDIISISWKYLGASENKIASDIKKKILNDNKRTAEKLLETYGKIDSSNIDQLLSERDFSAYRQVRLLNWCINSNSELKEVFKSVYNKYFTPRIENEDIPFFDRYNKDIITYRNALAHVKKTANISGDLYIGEIDGKSVMFDESLCNMLRKSLILYETILDEIYQCIEDM
jgi:hypothetical protein